MIFVKYATQGSIDGLKNTEKKRRKREMWDKTFCSKMDCKNLKCDRNQKNYNFALAGNRPISISNFSKCEYWEDNDGRAKK